MSKTDNGGPAFPVIINDDEADVAEFGMSLRDWFAGQALAAIIAQASDPSTFRKAYAADAYDIADAMLAARKGGQ